MDRNHRFPGRAALLSATGALLFLGVFAAGWGGAPPAAAAGETAGAASAGALIRLDEGAPGEAACPLKHTEVEVEISGFLARVTAVQQFENPFGEPIEAVYVFPLPQRAAVDRMRMKIGDRVIVGKIKRREEARAIYEAAKARGHLASLLDQERPNVFTQSVANIPPGAAVEIEISYVETLGYEEGVYEFSFPMVVGPRYIPGQPGGASGGGWAPDTDQVPDASRITPPVAKPATRAGHDISVKVTLDAGVPLRRVESPTHEIEVERPAPGKAVVRLKRRAVIPNKDFILRYDSRGAGIREGVLAHRDERGGFFTLILQPPERVTVEDVAPKELVFVLDTSGSMSGRPIEKAKEVIRLALEGIYPRDRFNVITFAGDTHILFPEPVPGTGENIRRAQAFIESRRGGGGTEMMKAIRAALAPSEGSERVRIVCFLTDGYVGNDMAILGEVERYENARVFSFGIGSSVNRFLLDRMAELSRGAAEYVGLNEDGSAAARRFHERIRNPLLTDIRIDWGGLPVTDVFPQRIPDLFAAAPVVVTGRYTAPAKGVIRLEGKMSGKPYVRSIPVELPAQAPAHEAIAKLWARRKVAALMDRDWAGMQRGSPKAEIREAVTKLGLDYGLVTQFTSLVAVEETVVVEGGRPRRIEVPVEMPEGVSYEGVFGPGEVKRRAMAASYGTHKISGVIGGVIGWSRQELRGPLSPPDAAAARTQRPGGAPAPAAESKLHPALQRALASGSPAGLAVREGRIAVEVWIDPADGTVAARLKALGFRDTGESKVAAVLIGWLPFEKLEEAARLAGARYIAPHRPR